MKSMGMGGGGGMPGEYCTFVVGGQRLMPDMSSLMKMMGRG